jgi:catechol 2,3-dioxygenase-like lactoylglutathione lyase family enzyme
MEPIPETGGFGSDGKPFFWISAQMPVQTGLHVALGCENRELVDAFHAAALAAGATDNRPPGPRPIDHPGYYGAYVLDPDGNNVEAVCHRPA